MKSSLAAVGMLAVSLLVLALPARAMEFELALGPSGTGSSATAAEKAAAELVRAALEDELAGGQRRDALLRQAVEEASDFGPARWHACCVRQNGRWLSLDEVGRQAAADQRLAEYVALREKFTDTAPAHAELARWCQRHAMPEQQRAHWIRALQLQPGNPEAIEALGLRPYEGMLLSGEQIEQFKQQKQAVLAAVDRRRPQFAQWKKALRPSDSPGQRAVLEELREITSPADIAAIEVLIRQQFPRDEAGRELLREFCLQWVAALGRQPHPAATLSLVRLAVDAPWEDVRAAAADQLKPRPVDDYVPVLMAALAHPIEFSAMAMIGADLSIQEYVSWYREGEAADMSGIAVAMSFRPTMSISEPGQPRRAIPADQKPSGIVRNWAGAARNAENTRRKVTQANAQTEALNERVYYVLDRAAAVNYSNNGNPDDYWKYWKEYNELEYPEEKPVYETVVCSVSHRPLPRLRPPTSCFARGTAVWTATGERPIENLKIGDLVLAQNPDTGELAFKPVLEVTTRTPSRMVKIDVGSETITATRGHPFWVNGQGWRMAKQLEAGQRLHAAAGAVAIDALAETDPAKPWYEFSYNLVVADFNTYFVGKSRLLVHDNTMRRPTPAVVPGLARTAVQPSPLAPQGEPIAKQ